MCEVGLCCSGAGKPLTDHLHAILSKLTQRLPQHSAVQEMDIVASADRVNARNDTGTATTAPSAIHVSYPIPQHLFLRPGIHVVPSPAAPSARMGFAVQAQVRIVSSSVHD